MNKRPCRYGATCSCCEICVMRESSLSSIRNPTCSFSHDAVTQPQSSYGGSVQPCRYGSSCKRHDCRFSHAPTTSPSHYSPSFPQHSSISSGPSSSMIPCRFGANCTASNCRFYHDDDGEEFSPEEEERIDEILDMIEQEQRAREGNSDDEEDDKNIDEIFAYIQNQQGSNPPQHDDFSLPEGADDEYEAMIQQQHQQQYHHHHHQQHVQHQQPFYGYQPQDEIIAQMNNLNMKGMSATSAPFVPNPNQ